MKKGYTLLAMIFITVAVQSQSPHFEDVGNPTTTTSVNTYTGWSDQTSSYTGTAEVQNVNPSNYNYASGLGNIVFTNTVGTYFQISGMPNIGSVYTSITFGLHGYDTSNPTILNELELMASIDSGFTWIALPYHRMFEGFWSPKPWDIFTATLGQVNNTSRLIFRFNQTTSTKPFRIDDIEVGFTIALPIKLNYFKAVANREKASITWSASTTSDKDVFVIEKGTNGELFSPLQKIKAKGNGEFNYVYNDAINDKTFYRLKMIDIDGKSTYSNIAVVKPPSQLIQEIYPIPAKDLLHIRLNNPTSQAITLSVADVSGHQRLRQILKTEGGAMIYDLNMQALEAGVYYLTVFTSDQHYTERIVVTK